jgi:hypothetical protein
MTHHFPDQPPPDADLKLSWEIMKLQAEVYALRRPFQNPPVIAALVTTTMLAVVGLGGLAIQWARSDREFQLAELKAIKLENDTALLRQQRAALTTEVAARNAEVAILRHRVDEALATLQATSLSETNLEAQQLQLTKTASALRSAATPIGVAGSIIASPDTITPGQSARLSWNSFDATKIAISPDVGSVAPAGSVEVSPKRTTTYTTTMSNETGSVATGTATVFVAPRHSDRVPK